MLTDQDIQRMVDVLQPKFNSLEESISNLAILTKRGFDNCVTKDEFNDFKEEVYSFKLGFDDFKNKTEQSLFGLDLKVNEISSKVNKMEEKLGHFTIGFSSAQKEIQQLNYRVGKAEEKIGITD